MMFRRWRRTRLTAEASEHVAAPAPRPSAADLRGEQIFDLLHGKLSEFIGSSGEWTLVRRTDADSDRIFHAIVTHQIAVLNANRTATTSRSPSRATPRRPRSTQHSQTSNAARVALMPDSS